MLRSLQEHAERLNGATAIAASPEPDDGYVSPEFDLPSEDKDERAAPVFAHKRRKVSDMKSAMSTLEDEEALALQMLRSRR